MVRGFSLRLRPAGKHPPTPCDLPDLALAYPICHVFVQSVAPHVGKAGRYCVQRPPSICYGRVAMPAEVRSRPLSTPYALHLQRMLPSCHVQVEHVPAAERATLRLHRLNESEAGPDVAALARALNAPDLQGKQLLLLDKSAVVTPDALRSLLVSPKGWLCTLEHKSCQHAC